ncbi:hypothetical protein GCM10010231_07620 [Streptomyces sindenensis]|nr:hypothetical protein GCM10010231_07620 [Streptomyces sindenensis]
MRLLRAYDPPIEVFRRASGASPPGTMENEPDGTRQDPEGRNRASLWGRPPRDFPLTATDDQQALFSPGEAACPPDAASPDLTFLAGTRRSGEPARVAVEFEWHRQMRVPIRSAEVQGKAKGPAHRAGPFVYQR